MFHRGCCTSSSHRFENCMLYIPSRAKIIYKTVNAHKEISGESWCRGASGIFRNRHLIANVTKGINFMGTSPPTFYTHTLHLTCCFSRLFFTDACSMVQQQKKYALHAMPTHWIVSSFFALIMPQNSGSWSDVFWYFMSGFTGKF